MSWPPSYTITVSQRAKNVYLKISPEHGLVCVVPKRYDQRQLHALIESKRRWIEKHLQHHQTTKPINKRLPSKVTLRAANRHWQVNYIPLAAKLKLIEIADSELTIYGDITDKSACRRLLIQWTKAQAKKILGNELQHLSQKTKLNYNDISIRDQKSRWGSCSAEGNISLNYKLLFLPHELMQHILIHELCHTKHLNHSKHFWKLVCKHDPHYHEHNKQLKTADKYIPGWAQPQSK